MKKLLPTSETGSNLLNCLEAHTITTITSADSLSDDPGEAQPSLLGGPYLKFKTCFIKTAILLAFFALNIFNTKAQPGTLDSSFGNNGFISLPSQTPAAVFQSDGKLIAGLTRYNTNGKPDSSFGINGTASSTFTPVAFALQKDDKLVVAGYAQVPLNPQNNAYYFVFARYNLDGTLDLSFGNAGNGIIQVERGSGPEISSGRLGQIQELYISNDNEIIFTLRYDSPGGPVYRIKRINSVGQPLEDLTFRGTLNLTSSRFFALATSIIFPESGNIIVGGYELGEIPETHEIVVRALVVSYTKSGVVDSSFGTNGIVELFPSRNFLPTILAIQKDGKILGSKSTNLFRLNNNGTLDATFGNSGITTIPFVTGKIIVQDDDKIIIGGGLNGDFALARFNRNGTLDSSFGTGGMVTSDFGSDESITSMVVAGDRLYAYGSGIIAAYLIADNSIVLSCPGNKTVPTDKGVCSSLVNNIDPIITPPGSAAFVSYTLSDATTGSHTGSASGTIFNKGKTTVTYKLVSDPTKTCSFKVTVEDKESPMITNASVSAGELWPPNHKLREVEITYNLADNCGCGAKAVISVSSNEPESGTDKDDEAGDWKIIDAHHVQLRAERSGKGDGRVYTITITATDAAGNKTQQQVSVIVPHDKGVVKDKKVKDNLSVRLLSNPTKSFFVLELQSKSDELVSLRVIDIFGRIVETRSGISPNGRLQVGSAYGAGIYFAELKQGNKKEIATMIKL